MRGSGVDKWQVVVFSGDEAVGEGHMRRGSAVLLLLLFFLLLFLYLFFFFFFILLLFILILLLFLHLHLLLLILLLLASHHLRQSRAVTNGGRERSCVAG
jgi:hypothetical protein